MKQRFLLFSLLLLPLISGAQRYAELLNNEFDNWDANGYTPSGWVTIESVFGKDYGMADQETTDKVNSSASATLTTNDFGRGPFYSLLSCGTGYYSTSPSGVVLQGIPYTDTPAALWVLYKSAPEGKDTSGLLINMYQNRTGVQEGILQRAFYLNPAASWRLLKIDLKAKYIRKETPDSIVFTFYSSITKIANRKLGTKLQVDGVYFNEPTPLSIGDATAGQTVFTLYPNPCAGTKLWLNSGIKLSGCTFELHGFDGVQKKSVRLVNDGANEIGTEGLLPGAYLWIVTDRQGNIAGKGKCILL
ncbi:MAG: hypothetical protein JNL13_10160 [Chitinophagaceae bacterium]|nr:hypothetical protein [Chitinophagaceae bacterium]